MKVGEIWRDKNEIHYVKIVVIYEDRYLENMCEQCEWVVFDYCDENGVLGPDEYQHGDSLPRYRFIKQYEKLYK